MTIDEFMRDIAPKMRKGWVAMSAFGSWKYYCGNEPHITPCEWENGCGYISLFMFDISPCKNWTQSLRKVGE